MKRILLIVLCLLTLSAPVSAQMLLSTPLTKGLVSYWALDDGSGTTATDSSANGNDMTIYGATTWTTGVSGDALSFGAASADYAGLASPSGLSNQYVSAACWVYADAMEQYHFIINHNWANTSGAWTLYTDQTQIGFGVYSGSALYLTNYTTDISGGWHHLVGVYDGSYVRLYLDGTAVGTPTALPGQVLDTTSYINISYDAFGKKVDEVRIYNRALSAAEVAHLADLGLNHGLVGHWKFDEGTGTTATDSSVNGNNGTLVNGPSWVTGVRGTALSFDGVDDYVDCGSGASLDITDAITYVAWIKPNNLSTNNRDPIISKRTANVAAPYYLMTFEDRLNFAYYGLDGAWHGYYSNTGLTTDWQCVAVTFSSITNQATFYRNGISLGTVATTSRSDSYPSFPVRIGVDPPYGYFDGLIDEVRIYNRALSDSEIAQLYAQETPPTSGAWYYPAGVTDTSDDAETTSGWAENSYVYGGRIQAGATGTATKIAVKISTSESSATGLKIGLYDDSNNLLAQCSTTAPGTAAWAECTISQAVTSGTYYRVFSSTETNNFAHRYTTGQTGYYGTCAYTSAMCDPVTSVGSEANGYAARMWIQ